MVCLTGPTDQVHVRLNDALIAARSRLNTKFTAKSNHKAGFFHGI